MPFIFCSASGVVAQTPPASAKKQTNIDRYFVSRNQNDSNPPAFVNSDKDLKPTSISFDEVHRAGIDSAVQKAVSGQQLLHQRQQEDWK